MLNSRENENVTESLSLPLGAGPLRALSGRVGPHAYVLGKIEGSGQRLWLQANTEYPERDTEMALTAPRPPALKVTPAAALKNSSWDESRKALTVRLSHAAGAVEVTLNSFP